METYVILRRGGWRTADDLAAAAERSTSEGERMPDDIAWIRSYVLEELDGTVGTVCIYQATGPEAIRRCSRRVSVTGRLSTATTMSPFLIPARCAGVPSITSTITTP